MEKIAYNGLDMEEKHLDNENPDFRSRSVEYLLIAVGLAVIACVGLAGLTALIFLVRVVFGISFP